MQNLKLKPIHGLIQLIALTPKKINWKANASMTSNDFLSKAVVLALSNLVNTTNETWPPKLNIPIKTIKDLSKIESGKQVGAPITKTMINEPMNPIDPANAGIVAQWTSEKC